MNNRDPRGFDRNRDRDFGLRVNERIRVREVRVIDDIGGQLGVMTPREALDIAREKGLDLIEVAPNAQPPVCRIMDYGKYKFEQGKREREQAKKQRQAAEIKGMTLRPGTDDHDLDFKIKNIVKFLGEGEKVKVTVRFRSREMSHPEFAYAAMNKISQAAVDAGVGLVERQPIMEGRQMIMVLTPTKEAGAPPTPAPKKPSVPKPAPASTTIGSVVEAPVVSSEAPRETTAPEAATPVEAPAVEAPAPVVAPATETSGTEPEA